MNAVLLILLRWNHERSAADTVEGDTMNAVLLILLRGHHERSAADTAGTMNAVLLIL